MAFIIYKVLPSDWITVRAFLDSGSQVNYITTRTNQLLRLPTSRTNLQIHGIGGIKTDAGKTVTTQIRSLIYHLPESASIEELIERITLPNETYL